MSRVAGEEQAAAGGVDQAAGVELDAVAARPEDVDEQQLVERELEDVDRIARGNADGSRVRRAWLAPGARRSSRYGVRPS